MAEDRKAREQLESNEEAEAIKQHFVQMLHDKLAGQLAREVKSVSQWGASYPFKEQTDKLIKLSNIVMSKGTGP